MPVSVYGPTKAQLQDSGHLTTSRAEPSANESQALHGQQCIKGAQEESIAKLFKSLEFSRKSKVAKLPLQATDHET